MERKLRVGVIGVGQMGTYHAQIYSRLPQVELVALCEFDDERRAEVEKEFGTKVCKYYQDLLSDNEIDAVSIVLPDNIHREAVELAVKYNKHILLEKPLAKELSDGKALYEITKDYQKVFSVGFLLRYDPRFAMVKERLDAGELGDIIHLYCRRNSPIIGPRRYIGASDLSMHVMSHDIDYINWYMGCDPISVVAKNRSVLLKENNMNDVIYALVTYANGAIACLEACWVLPENSPTMIDDQLELVGTKGVAYIDSSDKGVRFIGQAGVEFPDTRHWYYMNGEIYGDLAVEVETFVNDSIANKKSTITPKAALDSLKVVDAIERSIKEGKEVSIY